MARQEYDDPDYVSPVAQRVIDIMGGVKAVQLICGFSSISPVHKWTYARSKGGTGGRIPERHQQRLYDVAYERGLLLKATDFFEDPASKEGSRAGADAGNPAQQTSL